jgi:hypothetical protein
MKNVLGIVELEAGLWLVSAENEVTPRLAWKVKGAWRRAGRGLLWLETERTDLERLTRWWAKVDGWLENKNPINHGTASIEDALRRNTALIAERLLLNGVVPYCLKDGGGSDMVREELRERMRG